MFISEPSNTFKARADADLARILELANQTDGTSDLWDTPMSANLATNHDENAAIVRSTRTKQTTRFPRFSENVDSFEYHDPGKECGTGAGRRNNITEGSLRLPDSVFL